MTPTSRVRFFSILILAPILSSHFGFGQTTDTSPSSSSPVRVSQDVASALVVQKSPLKYPDAARAADIEGTVVLRIVVGNTGAVKEVAVISGDPILAEPTADSVKQWKYKPYEVNGVPVEMETELSINFHIKPSQTSPPPLGTFKDEAYSNAFLGILYPLSRDWVRETEIMRKKAAADTQPPATYVLLAAVHVPQHTAPLEADSSFVLSAVSGGPGSRESCDKYIQALGAEIHSSKQGKQNGDVSKSTITGRDFYRADFEFNSQPRHRAFICSQSSGYLLQWNIAGLSKNAIDAAASTLNLIQSPPPPSATPSASDAALKPVLTNATLPSRVRVSQGVTAGMVVKKVQPIYPEQARQARIQGTVRMSAIISKTGDVVDIEVTEGPIELVVSAVNAVRQWKYRPYLVKGEPVEVDTQLTVNYTLSG
jgi:TonB family protein